MFNSTSLSTAVRSVHQPLPQNGFEINSAHNLGYGAGRLIRSVFDQLSNSWQRIWKSEPDRLSSMRAAIDRKKSPAKRALQQSGYPASFDLTTLNGVNGFAIPGIAAGGYLGSSVSTAGDINGDGKTDFVLGAPDVSSYTGAAYVIFGQASGWPASFNLATLNGANGFAIPGIATNDYLGTSVSTVGDINGDGRVDLVLGANGVSSTSGAAYVIFGQVSGWPATFNLTTLNGTNGFVIPGIVSGGSLGYSVSTAGDVNGDGKVDLVLGAPYVSSDTGTAYVIFGQTSGWPASFNLATLNGTNGFAIPGIAATGQLGWSVSTAGDINGDGKADLVLGANSASSETGAAYVIFGQGGSWLASFNLATLNGANGFAVPGIAATGWLGTSVSTTGDINGDGRADLVLGAYGVSSYTGAAYVIFGQTSGWPASFNLALLNGTNGFVIPGIATYDNLGYSVSTAGDINGDGYDDLLLGAESGPALLEGATYVLFGQASGWPASFNISTLSGANGFAILGNAANNQLGTSVNTAGDINGDGLADLLLGASHAVSYSGEVYVIFGTNASSSPTSSSNPSVLSSPPVPSLPTFQTSFFTAIFSPLLVVSTTPNPTALSPTSLMPPPSPANSATNGTTPSSLGTTIGIAVGVGAPVLIGGIIGLILFLRFKKKGCFAKEASEQRLRQDEELGLAQSLFIPKKEIEIEKKIAEGNFGDVYRGRYQNGKVAVKQLKGQLTSQAEVKLFGEVKIMSELRSRYIVTFYGVTKEQPYQIVMEFMEGGSLRDFLKSHDVDQTSWNLRFQIGHDIVQGLKYLHQQKIVHADLKSLNVLLDEKTHARLADFGLASVKSENAEAYYQDATQVKGSLLWMAPELFDQSRHTFATDMFSFGVVLWEIATHRLPFQEFDWKPSELISQVLRGKREKFSENTPEAYEKLAQKCWDGNPANRPSAEQATTILTRLWNSEGKKNENASTGKQDPTYLTGTYEGKMPDYAAETKFGI